MKEVEARDAEQGAGYADSIATESKATFAMA